jgi:Cupin-like domain
MLRLFIAFFVFCIVLFIYLHVQFHLKTSNDLEVYELDMASKDKMDEICDLRQPVLFDFENANILQHVSISSIMNNYHAFEIKIRNALNTDYNSEIYMPLPLHSAKKLFDGDKESTYFSENNSDFLQETGVVKHMQYNDEFIRPPMVSNCNYDVLLGSENVKTPFRYEINYRNFFLVTEGRITVKLAPPQNSKYLYPVRDYENFEFRSPVNPWNVQPQYSADFDKIKCLEVILLPGKTIHIPAYWWYSIQFDKESSIACFKYRTYMNNAAIVPHIAMHALQLQNIKREVAKKHDIQELNKESAPQDNIHKKELKEEPGEEDNEILAHDSTNGLLSSNIL